ncbi:NADP(H)-dependent aldo-keto reductase [Paraburkholderia sp. SIMBA_055]|jgi:aryl-alcohol dehydrogenase-like predicted oxidoreductase|uniref:Protein tas n=1 Tax=Paraburkholderia graminis (strain ATCC 700544 / DSM 17151 / LMG 18924 / NCIMB 13744 / C4D1M) TaxID=396598 RepID=B1FYM4_PARG4|nr:MULTISPECIES: NADP(H)-dependent aldo-keto reductase [Paraburkholderia]AXF07835.1 NADP(H)-dependent aldo-keto reductase [Paraburkholderia graminis]EDT10865.1 aldo/keto reductase [Paraburkholderia graminis C4D1M]MDR6466593.1 aryl-alcohol dehydrogenase-like predicted oxidoreductase [Paraburkholderia graminis]PTR00334.1 aryl-alcohol dehydrogenase-like predicted oxidoreductase [Paraburkholderia sp. GV072]PUB05182.1 aryl-alcohol dehydrogenase-like predicted oxidoreductase [Paraburkholderia sp. GV
MEYRRLGDSDVQVSLIGLGTMTWGEQNTEQEAHAQIDYALDHGVNLIDTAEMYPVPPRAETQGSTERFIGTWLAQHRSAREKIVLATKIAGPARQPHNPRHIRGETNQFDRKNLTEALNDSLKRLQTDYVDLYQLHWPDRNTMTFGRPAYPWVDDEYTVPIEETLSVLADFVKAGKVRHVGVSNETPWGVAQFLRASEKLGLPRIVSIQNPYSLLNRTYEVGLSEYAHRDNIGLLAYSPLAFGWLSGKYEGGARPAGARISLFERFQRYSKPQAVQATTRYVELAKRHGLSPAQFALAFVNSRPFVTSNLIGATSLDQLKENIASVDVKLSQDVLDEIDALHQLQPNPAP